MLLRLICSILKSLGLGLGSLGVESLSVEEVEMEMQRRGKRWTKGRWRRMKRRSRSEMEESCYQLQVVVLLSSLFLS